MGRAFRREGGRISQERGRRISEMLEEADKAEFASWKLRHDELTELRATKDGLIDNAVAAVQAAASAIFGGADATQFSQRELLTHEGVLGR